LQVDDDKLTLGEIQKNFADSKFESAQQEFEAQKEYAEKAFGRFLLIKGAKEAGLTADLDSAAISQLLLKVLYIKNIMNRVNVTDKEIDDFFQKYGGEIEAAQIAVDDSLLADSLYQVLKKGGDFEKLARDFSRDKWHGPKGGIIGYISYNSSNDEIMKIVFGLKNGEFSQPIHFGSGWLIIKIYDRIKNTKEDLEKNKSTYENLASQQLQKLEMNRFADEVRSKLHYESVKPTIQLLILKEDSIKTVASEESDRQNPAVLDTSCFTDSQRQLPLARYDGGAFTINDYISALSAASQARPSDPRDTEAFEEYLKRATINSMLYLMAKKEKIDRDKQFKDEVESQKSDMLVQKMTAEIYKGLRPISEADARKYYNEHPDKFYMPDQIRASVIAVKTKEEAQNLLQRIRNGANIYMLAKKYSLDRKSANESGDIGFFTVARYTPIYQAGENLKKGEFGGPVEFEGNWWIFKVTDRIEKYLKSFDLSRSNAYSQAAADLRAKAVDDFFEKMKEKTHYVRDYDLIKENLTMGPLDQTGKGNE
jgi:parvulin-like peptidyl-prolyl isomerase